MTTTIAPATTAAPAADTRYLAPGWFTRNVMNRSIRRLARIGVSLAGSAELRVVGRRSGQVRSTVVNVLELDGVRYLVAPRGVAEWVRNLRAADGAGDLRVGRRVTHVRATELADDDKVEVLRAYVTKWGWEVGAFFPGLSKNSTDEELRAVAAGFPAFRLTPSPASA